MKKWLKGKKTYIIAICGGIVYALAALNIITPDVAEKIYGVLSIGGAMTIRAAIEKLKG